METDWVQTKAIIERALHEDLVKGDVTTDALILPKLRGKASIIVQANGVLAGIEVAGTVFHQVEKTIRFDVLIPDGNKVGHGDVVATVEGNVSSILKAERVALNFLQHLSGVASQTALYVEAIGQLPVRITDTRKTVPGLRLLEKYAVKVGGGHSHRLNLGDGILIKDNHLAILRSQGMDLKQIIAQAKLRAPQFSSVEVEVDTREEALEAIEAGADIILLDNMSAEEMSQVVKSAHEHVLLEASGGITLDNVRAIAETGINFISIGALTHSFKSLDISIELESFGELEKD